jgi:hypothetical protein
MPPLLAVGPALRAIRSFGRSRAGLPSASSGVLGDAVIRPSAYSCNPSRPRRTPPHPNRRRDPPPRPTNPRGDIRAGRGKRRHRPRSLTARWRTDSPGQCDESANGSIATRTARRALRTRPGSRRFGGGSFSETRLARVVPRAHRTNGLTAPSLVWIIGPKTSRFCANRAAMLGRTKSGVSMAFAVGKRVVAESESIARRPCSGVVEEVFRGDPSPRYRIRWDDGHESIYTPASGALRAEPRPTRRRQAPRKR